MKFFEDEQIYLALHVPTSTLEENYKKSERMLKIHAMNGDVDALAEEMRKHRLVEYARLFQSTPQFREMKRKEFLRYGKVYRA